MRRLARHVVCTIALLLIWVAVASADGGWVLWVWKYTVAGAGTRLHEVDSVHVSRNACDIALVFSGPIYLQPTATGRWSPGQSQTAAFWAGRRMRPGRTAACPTPSTRAGRRGSSE